DFTLLYCAKAVAKNPAHIFRLFLASVFGACFAVVFPLFKLGSVLSVLIKLVSGLIICVIAGKFTSFKAYIKLTALFLAFTALLGGALIGIFSLAGISYDAGSGFVLSSVPIGIPLFGALLLIIFARKIAAKLKKTDKTEVSCTVCKDEKNVSLSGFFDSGNKVYYLGQPVCVIPLTAAQKIIDETRIETFVKIHTVAESKKLKVFTADKLEIRKGEKVRVLKGVKIAVTPYADKAILHPDYMEEIC
nr:sigma-E processing peptidase SpoIIGA [Clostridia bacterium]